MPAENIGSLTKIMKKIVLTDQNELKAARQFLQYSEETDVKLIIKKLTDILIQNIITEQMRRTAGLHFVNILKSKQQWLELPEDIRLDIKINLLTALQTEITKPSVVAKCIVAIATAELPVGQWKDLIPRLVDNIIDEESTELEMQAMFHVIDRLCQEVPVDELLQYGNLILTAVVHGMRCIELSKQVQLAATKAFHSLLKLTEANFKNEDEGSVIIEVVCEVARSSDVDICVLGIQCLDRIFTLYYKYMESYIDQVISVTTDAVKSNVDDISLEAIQFWINTSEKEVKMNQVDLSPGDEKPQYTKKAVEHLGPALLQRLTIQDMLDDEVDWNQCKLAITSLIILLVECHKNVVVDILFPFINTNLKNEDRRYRDSALTIMGCIAEAEFKDGDLKFFEEKIPILIEAMHDTSIAVRDSATWSLGKISEFIPEVIMKEMYIKPFFDNLVNGLKDEPRVAESICFALPHIAKVAYETADSEDSERPNTTCASEYIDITVQRMFDITSTRHSKTALKTKAFHALYGIVKYSPLDCTVTVQMATMLILEQLQQILQMKDNEITADECKILSCMMNVLFETLKTHYWMKSPDDLPVIADAAMPALMTFLDRDVGKNDEVMEAIFLVISDISSALGEDFLKHMNRFQRHLVAGIKHQDVNVSIAAVGVVSEISSGLKWRILPYNACLIYLLTKQLESESVDVSVKPYILSALGDISLAIGKYSKHHFNDVVPKLLKVVRLIGDAHPERSELVSELQEHALGTLTFMIHGVKENASIMDAHLTNIISFMEEVGRHTDRDDQHLGLIAGLAGDICTVRGPDVLHLLKKEQLMKLLQEAQKSKTPRTKVLASWAIKEISKAALIAANSDAS